MDYNIGDTLIFDDNIEYTVIAKDTIDGTIYLYLSYIENNKPQSKLVKQISENNEQYLVNLDNETEFTKVMEILSMKVFN